MSCSTSAGSRLLRKLDTSLAARLRSLLMMSVASTRSFRGRGSVTITNLAFPGAELSQVSERVALPRTAYGCA